MYLLKVFEVNTDSILLLFPEDNFVGVITCHTAMCSEKGATATPKMKEPWLVKANLSHVTAIAQAQTCDQS